jgi:REP element-mobilizing transposase RayT
MPHAYTSNLFHIVFSTKERLPGIREPAKLWAYLAGVARNLNFEPLSIGGTENHVHVLLRIPNDVTLAEAVQKLKSNSSRWLRENGRWFGWQKRIWRIFCQCFERLCRPAGWGLFAHL